MTIAVRYYSRLGNTKKIAQAIAEGAGVEAISITEEPVLTERVETLFLGGAPYANIMAPELQAYAKKLSPQMVGNVVLFTTSNWSRRTVYALRKLLQAQHVAVASRYFFAHMLHIAGRLETARNFGREQAER